MSVIYHITTASEWEEARRKGAYEAESLKKEGFIHCSEERQIPDILKRFYSHESGLVKLSIDTDKLTSRLIYNWSNAVEDTFPHIYGPINLDAVIKAEKI